MEIKDGKQILTHSALQCFGTCPQMYKYRYIDNISAIQDEEVLTIGRIVHDGVEAHLLGKPLNTLMLELTEKYTSPDMDLKAQYAYCKATGIVNAYYEHYRAENVVSLNPLCTETNFNIPLTRTTETGNIGRSQKFQLAGVVDAVVSDYSGKVFLMEHKTTSIPLETPAYWQRLSVDNQISLYWQAATQAMGYNVEGVLYNVIYKPQLQPKTTIPVLDENGVKIVIDQNTEERVYNANGKPRLTSDKEKGYELVTRDEEPLEFEQRVYDAMVNDPDRYFVRRKISRLQADLVNAEKDYWFFANLINQCNRNDYYPRTTGACMKWGKPCPYLNICSTGGLKENDPIPSGYEYRKAHEELKINNENE